MSMMCFLSFLSSQSNNLSNVYFSFYLKIISNKIFCCFVNLFIFSSVNSENPESLYMHSPWFKFYLLLIYWYLCPCSISRMQRNLNGKLLYQAMVTWKCVYYRKVKENIAEHHIRYFSANI